MPEEYVYKIVVDDADVNRAIDTIDKKIQTLAQRMDSAFRGVGSGATVGAQRAAQQTEQASQRVRRAEQQTAQAVTAAQRQVGQARESNIRQASREIQLAEQRKRSAEEAYRIERESLQDITRTLERLNKERERAAQHVQNLQRAGATPNEISRAQGKVTAIEGDIAFTEPLVAERQKGVAGAQAGLDEATAAYDQLVASRQEASEQIAQIAQQQSAAEATAAQEAAQGVQTAEQIQTQSVLQGAQERLQAAREEARQKRESLTIAEQVAQAATLESDAASRAAQLRKRAYEDAKEATKAAAAEQATAAKELAEAEKDSANTGVEALKERKEAADDNLKATKEAEEAARAAYNDSKRAAEDASATARDAGRQRTEASKQASAAAKVESNAEKELKQTTAALANEKKNAAKAERDAEREFVRTAKTFARQRHELDLLAQKHGSFNVTIGKSASEMNEYEREVWDVIQADAQLAREIDKILAKQKEFNVEINRSTFAGGPPLGIQSGQLRQAGFAAQRLGVPGAAAIGEAAAVGGAAGVAAAGVLLTVKQLVDAFKTMADWAKKAFETIVKGAIDSAREIEVARAQFEAFFQQDISASEAALKRLQQLSLQLGENVVSIGRAFLPEVESLDQLEEVTKIAVALSRFQPEQGILGARIALQEALAGEFRSLQRRFEISPVAIDQIRNAFETSGVTGLLEALQGELERTGRSAEDLSDTFGVAVGRIQERWRQFLQQVGDPIIEELKDQLSDIDDELNRLDPDLDAIADAFGEVIAKFVEIIGSEIDEFLESFDPAAIYEVVKALDQVAGALEVFFTAVGLGESSATGLEAILYGISSSLLSLEGHIISASLELAKFTDQIRPLLPQLQELSDLFDLFGKNTGGPLGVGIDVNEKFLDALVIVAESGGTLEEAEAAMAAYLERVADYPQTLEEFIAKTRSGNEEGEEAANTFLKMTSGLEELIVIQGQYKEAQEAVNEAVNEFNIDAQLKLEKILLDAQRARLDFEIEAAQKTIDIERKNADKVADIRSGYTQNILDAAQDLSDREADILRKYNDSVFDLEEDRNDKRLDAEKKYQDELQRIRDRYNFQAFEAILANDAKQLRQIRRRQAFEESQAKKDRDRNVRDVDAEINDRREKLDRALDREIRDARIANARKIRDLAQSLDEQLKKQEEARRRDLRDQGIAEARKRAELTQSLNEQLQDYNTWWEERNRTTADKIETDLQLMRDYVQSAVEIMNELNQLGIVFNPLTGQPEFAFSMPNIEPITAAISGIQDRVSELTAAEEFLNFGQARDRDVIAEEVAAMSVTDLVDELDRLQKALAISDIEPNKFIETTNLARQLLMDQALSLGRDVGMSAQTIINETLGLSMRDLEKWIDEFIAKYTVPELPEFSLFGFTPEELLSQAGPMSQQQEGPFSSLPGYIPGQFTPGLFPGQSPFQTFPGATDTSNVEGFGIFDDIVSQMAVPGQTQFVFPNVTDAPYLTPTEDQVQQQQFVPGFGQAVGMSQYDADNAFLPGNILGTNPAYGLTAEDFQAELDKQVAAQVTAELLKRGEIEDTVAFADLMIEKQVLAIASRLDEEVAEFQSASDDEIAILEDTIRRQKETLQKLKDDPVLAEEAQAVQESIDILEDALERQREAASQANKERIAEEGELFTGTEEEKQDAQSRTFSEAEQFAINKANAIAAGLDEETAAQVAASLMQVGTIRTQEAEEKAIRDEGRLGELEAEEEHTDSRLEQLGRGFGDESDLLYDFWKSWIRLEQQGATRDLELLQEWINQRNALIQQAATTGPGIIPGVGGETTEPGTGGNQASIQQLQQLALSQAQELGILTPLIQGDIMDMSYDELVGFIEYLQGQLGYAAVGGSAQPGQPMMVGELGQEIVRFPGTANIDPVRSLLFRTTPPVGINGSNIDNSMNLGGFNFPDPRGLPPVYIKMMETIAANIIRNAWAGRVGR